MNKQLLDKIEQAMQAQNDTIARQSQMLDMKDQDIADLSALLKKLAQAQTEKAKQLPVLLAELSESIPSLIKHYQDWSQAQAKITVSQQIFAKELLALAESQTSSIGLMKNYQNELPRLMTLKGEVANYEEELQQLSLSQGTINVQLKRLSDTLK